MKFEKLITAIIIIEFILCLYSANTTTSTNLFCSVKGSCDIVQTSSYSHILGLKLSELGSFAFILLLFCWVERDKKFFYYSSITMSLVGASLAVFYICVQLFVLRAICESCLIIDGLAIILYILIFKECIRSNKMLKIKSK